MQPKSKATFADLFSTAIGAGIASIATGNHRAWLPLY